jgi:hypothetical protein
MADPHPALRATFSRGEKEMQSRRITATCFIQRFGIP